MGLAGLEPAASSLSEIDSQAPCYPAFTQAVRLRQWRRDGVNHDGSTPARRLPQLDPVCSRVPGHPPGPWRHWARRAPPLANLRFLLRLGEAPRWALNQPDELLDPEARRAFRPTRGGLRRARALPHRLARDEGAGAVSPTVGSRSPAPWPARPGPWPASVGRPAGVGRRSRPWPHRLAAESRTGPRSAAAQRPLGRRAPPGP